nr:MAG TPA: hypothetical protein [Caudoviricetes sp.]
MIKLENVVLANIHRQYKLNEWRDFCKWGQNSSVF